jgi:Flp pilus assembly protein TadB
MVECAMFYVIIFGLAAVLLVVAFLMAMSRRRKNLAQDDVQVSPTHAAHGAHPNTARRRSRKAKRAQSQHDRRKRH